MPSTDSTQATDPCRGARVGARACAVAAIGAALLAGVAAGAQAQVPGGPTSPPITAPPPPPAPPPIAAPDPAPDPPAPAPQPPVSAGELPPKLTQIYAGDDGGALYLRAEGTKVVGFAEHPGRKYAFVFRGTRTKDLINGAWYDVAKNTRTTVGTIQLKIFKKGDRLVRKGGQDFGPDIFNAIAASKVPWPGPREAGFQARSRSDLDGAFVGKNSAMEPDGSREYWREISSGAYGVAEAGAKAGARPAWVSVFFGKRQADGSVAGEYFDVPKGTEIQSGRFARVARQFGRNYVTGNIGWPSGRPRSIEADYALDLDRIAAAVDKHFRNKVVGYGWAISSDGKVVRTAGGGSSYLSETHKGFDINQPFSSSTESPLASTTKLVTATAVMQVLAKRGLSFQSKVFPYYPDCWTLGPGMKSLTFEDLLDHSSGLSRPQEFKAKDSYLFEMKAAEGGLTGKKGYENMNYTHLGWLLAGLLDKPRVEAAFAAHGCGKGTEARDETLAIYGDYVIDMLADQGIAAGWKFRTSDKSRKYNFADQSLPGLWPDLGAPNPTGGLIISADEFGEFMADLEHGRFVSHQTVDVMKDHRFGFNDLTSNGGPANKFRASDGLGLGYKKYGGCENQKGRGCGSILVMLPGDVQIVATFNSRQNATTENAIGLMKAWESGIR